MVVHIANMMVANRRVSPGVQSVPDDLNSREALLDWKFTYQLLFYEPFFKNQLNKLEPIMMQTIKHENIIPKGTSSLLGMSRTGVHKNTKIYMQLSMIL